MLLMPPFGRSTPEQISVRETHGFLTQRTQTHAYPHLASHIDCAILRAVESNRQLESRTAIGLRRSGHHGHTQAMEALSKEEKNPTGRPGECVVVGRNSGGDGNDDN